MISILPALIVIGLFLALDLLALHAGRDSRERYGTPSTHGLG